MANYIHVPTGEYPVTEQQIRARFQDTSFPVIFVPPEEFKVVFIAPVPPHDPDTHVVREIAPELTHKGHYEQRFNIERL